MRARSAILIVVALLVSTAAVVGQRPSSSASSGDLEAIAGLPPLVPQEGEELFARRLAVDDYISANRPSVARQPSDPPSSQEIDAAYAHSTECQRVAGARIVVEDSTGRDYTAVYRVGDQESDPDEAAGQFREVLQLCIQAFEQPIMTYESEGQEARIDTVLAACALDLGVSIPPGFSRDSWGEIAPEDFDALVECGRRRAE